jgi:hypothetical protein
VGSQASGRARWRSTQRLGYFDDLVFGKPPKVAHQLAIQSNQPQELLSRWRDMVGEYSCLKLICEKDRLYALDGLASQLRQARRGGHGSIQEHSDEGNDPWQYEASL